MCHMHKQRHIKIYTAPSWSGDQSVIKYITARISDLTHTPSMETLTANRLCRQSHCKSCTKRTLNFNEQLSKMIGYVLLSVTCLVVTTTSEVPRQIEVIYSLVEDQDPSGTLVGNLLQEKPIRDILSDTQLRQAQFQYLSEIPDVLKVETTGVIMTAGLVDRDVLCPNLEVCVIQIDMAIQSIQPFTMVTIKITIHDINDNDPEFEEARISRHFLESAQPGNSFVLPSVTDLDSPLYSVKSIKLQPESDTFELRTTTKPDGSQETRLILKTALDRETNQEYQLQVLATDGGDPARSGSLDIHISVTDANDNHPVFDQDTYEVTIPENAPSGFIVTTVQATDLDTGLNGHVVYRMSTDTAASLGHVFNVHNQTGEITVKGQVDYEKAAILYLTIEAYDRGADPVPGETVVIVHVQDINDHAPEITVHTLGGPGIQETTVQEGTQDGTFVARVVVTDKDHNNNGKYNCTLKEEHFVLGPLGTDYLVTTQGVLDRELQAVYIIPVICKDFGSRPLSSTAHITVQLEDVNDNTPQFSQDMYYERISENKPPGTIIIQVNASDPDQGVNGELLYRIQGSEKQWFEVDSVTGIVKASRSLDREEESRHEIRVVVSDKGQVPKSSTATLYVDVDDTNDMPPTFTQSIYTFGIYENEGTGAEVGFVQAEDDDDEPFNMYTFSLLFSEHEHASSLFQMNPDTGRITVTQSLDREFQSVYSVLAVAVDTSEPYFSSSATVSIYVMDRNDNPPRFTFPSQYNNTVYISSELPIGHIITHVEAEDRDSDVNGRVNYEIVHASQDGLFFIDPYVGAVSVNADISGMDNMTFTLSIVASDSGENIMSTSTTLNIIVNKTRAGLGTVLKGDMGSNVIIVVIVACVSGILIVALILAIVIMLRKQQHNRRKNNRHKSRMEALKVMASTEVAMVKSPSKKTHLNSLNSQKKIAQSSENAQQKVSSSGGPQTHTTIVTEAIYSVPKKNNKVDLSLEKSRQWLETLEAASNNKEAVESSNVRASDSQTTTEDLEVPHAVPKLPLKSCLKNPLPTSTRKESGDNDSLNSGIVSNTDSGRGPSEQEDMSCRGDIIFVPDGSQKSTSFRLKNNPQSAMLPSNRGYYGNTSLDIPSTVIGSREHSPSPPRPIKSHMYSGPQRALLADILNNGKSYHRSAASPTLQTFGKHGSEPQIDNVHRQSFLDRSRNSLQRIHTDPFRSRPGPDNVRFGTMPGKVICPHSASTDMSQSQTYSLADMTGVYGDNGSSLTSSCCRASNHGDVEDCSSTSGSYVVDAKELAQEIDDIFFRDLIV